MKRPEICTVYFRALAAAVLALCLVLFAGCGGASQPASGPGAGAGGAAYVPQASLGGISTGEHRVIATVNEEDIYEDVFTEWFLQNMAMNYGLDLTADLSGEIAEYLEQMKYGYLPFYIEQIVLLQKALQDGVVLDDQEVSDNIGQIMMLNMMNEENFQTFLGMKGFTEASFRSLLKDMLTIERVYEMKTSVVTEPNTTPEEYYNDNPLEFRVGEARLVRHILVEDLGEAEAIIADLNDGADFGELVMEKSIDTSSAIEGGFIGPFYSDGKLVDGNGGLVAPFTAASFSLEEVGDFTQSPAESDFGFHIIILDEIIPPYTMAFADVKDGLPDTILQKAKDDVYEKYLNEVKGAAVITYADDIPVE
jgi:parvulin-like peptidyl-prolyl isomerase